MSSDIRSSGRPAAVLRWATNLLYAAGANLWNGQPNKSPPSAGDVAEGFDPGTKPATGWFNYLMWLAGSWIDYGKATKVQTWRVLTLTSPAAGDSMNGVTFNPFTGRWFCVGHGGISFRSPSARTRWEQNANIVSTPDMRCCAADNAGHILASGVGTMQETSDDGANYTSRTTAFAAPLVAASITTATTTGITFDAVHGLWIAALNVTVATAEGAIATSPDRTTWTLRHQSVGHGFQDLETNPVGVSVAVGIAGGISRSADGTTWTTSNLSVSTFFGVAWDEARNIWVIVGLGGLVYTSPDGISWTVQPVPTNGFGSFRKIACDGSLWVAGCTNFGGIDRIVYSTDAGIHWHYMPFETAHSLSGDDVLDVFHGDNQFVAVTSTGDSLTSLRVGKEIGWPNGDIV